MKKLIAISVVFALVAVAAFAQPAIGGQVKAGATLVAGGNGGDPYTKGAQANDKTEGMINARAGDDKVGGFVRVFARTDGGWFSPTAFTFAWWKPIDMLRLQFGANPDGDFGAAKITGWGYNAEAQDFVAIDNDSGDGIGDGELLRAGRALGFFGGFWAKQAVNISILPMDGLAINIGLPFGDAAGLPVANVYLSLMFQVAYTISDVGQLTITYKGGGQNAAKDSQGGDIYASFYLTMVENLGVDIGFHYHLKGKGEGSPPIDIGLGVKYDMGDFGVKFRLGAAVGGDAVPVGGGMSAKGTKIGFGVLPYYNLGSLTAFLSIGVGMFLPSSGDMVLDWYVNPYIAVPAGGMKFFAGIKILGLDSDRPGVEGVKWAVPIGVNYYF